MQSTDSYIKSTRGIAGYPRTQETANRIVYTCAGISSSNLATAEDGAGGATTRNSSTEAYRGGCIDRGSTGSGGSIDPALFQVGVKE